MTQVRECSIPAQRDRQPVGAVDGRVRRGAGQRVGYTLAYSYMQCCGSFIPIVNKINLTDA